ncbi:uncharacterized protein LOC144872403 isoform X2 [Branchiostoma floridae x Branchiostoma japonicum]
MDPRVAVPVGLLVLLALAAGGTAQGVWLERDPSWVVDSAGTPLVINGVTYDAAKALDGDTGTYWNPGGMDRSYNNFFIVLDLTAPHTITRVAVNNYGDTTHDTAVFTLQKSQAGSPYNWEDVVTVTNVQGGTDRRQEFGGFRGTARYWRFLITETHSGWQPWLTELDFYGDVDECADGTDNCHAQATCTNTDGSFTCDCTEGYSGNGVNCTDVDECADGTDNCHAQATCTNTDGSFTCDCTEGYSGNGVNCTDVDECADGTHNCHGQATCTNTDGSFSCECTNGHGGDGVTCADIDECANGTHNCHDDATCSNTDGGFNCTCYEGYAGDGVICTGLSDLVFTDVGMDYMTLSWTAFVNMNITRYRLRYRPAGASHRDLSPPPSPGDTAATVPGLWADTEYTFTLTAFGHGDQEIGEISGTETTAEVIVNVECHEDHMTVTFPRAALPAVDVDNMHLLDDSCGATVTDTEVTLRAGLQDCGTIQDSSEADKFIFTNEAIANQLTSDNGAVRGTPFSKRFRCEFLRQYVVSQGREILYNIPSPRVQVVDAENSFTFEMHMFTSSDFTATYNADDYPVQVTSADRLHFGLSVNSPLNDLQLFALRCLATPSTDPDDSPSVSIIQDGCDVDTTLQLDTERSNDMALYYSIQSFTFPNIDDPSLVYIHCTMVVCFQSDPDSRCSQGCIPPSRRRRAVSDLSGARVRRASERDHITTISQGPFKVENGQEEAAPLPTVGIAVGTAAGIAGVLLVAAAAFLVRKRRGRGAKEQAEDRVGFDNYSFELWGKDKAASATPKPE